MIDVDMIFDDVIGGIEEFNSVGNVVVGIFKLDVDESAEVSLVLVLSLFPSRIPVTNVGNGLFEINDVKKGVSNDVIGVSVYGSE